MAIAPELERIKLPNHVSAPPGELYSQEPQLETVLHLQQLILLLTSLEWAWRDRTDFFAAGNLTVYYSPRQRKSEDFRGPDFFVVLGTNREPRKSWVVWEEGGKYPDLVVEVLSDSTADIDRNLKKEIYQNIWRTPNYFWFDPDSLEFQGFHLVDGLYYPLEPDQNGRLWSQPLGLFLGLHETKLRFFSAAGELVTTPTEDALTSQFALHEAQQQVEQERLRANRLAARLRELGIDDGEE
jgi:Uma2 family endonuclease